MTAPAQAEPRINALEGFAPVSIGQRISALLISILFMLLLEGVAAGAYFLLRGPAGELIAIITAVAIAAVLGLAWLITSIIKAQRLGGMMLGLRYANELTGEKASGGFVLKLLLQAGIGAISAGIAPLVLWFTSAKQPYNRNWFDRKTHVMLVDERKGRKVGTPYEPTEEMSVPVISAVQFPGVSSDADRMMVGTLDVAPDPNRPVFDPAPMSAPPLGSSAGGSPISSSGSVLLSGGVTPALSGSSSVAPIAPITGIDGLITAVPGRPSSWASEASGGDSYRAAPKVVDREVAIYGEDLPVDRTQVPEESVGPQVRLADGRRLTLDPPTVLGRDPRAPGSHPDAVPMVVADPSVSKTHALVGVDDEGVWVMDLHSTNGVYLPQTRGGEPRQITPGRRVHVASGLDVLIGDTRISVP